MNDSMQRSWGGGVSVSAGDRSVSECLRACTRVPVGVGSGINRLSGGSAIIILD